MRSNELRIQAARVLGSRSLRILVLAGLVACSASCAGDDGHHPYGPPYEIRNVSATVTIPTGQPGAAAVIFTDEQDLDVLRSDMSRLRVLGVSAQAVNGTDLRDLRVLEVEGKDRAFLTFDYKTIARFVGRPSPGDTFVHLALRETDIATFVSDLTDRVEMKFHVEADPPASTIELRITLTLEYQYD